MSIIRYCKLNEDHEGDNVFDIARPGIFGNPYTHLKKTSETKNLIKVKSREDAIKLYSLYFDKMYESDDEFKREFDKMFNLYENGNDIYLGCFCKKDEKCHGDIIEQKLIQFSMKNKIKSALSKRKDCPLKK